MKISNTQLKLYYLPNKQIESLAKKHLPKLIKLYRNKDLFKNKNLQSYERLNLENKLIDKTIKILKENKNLFYDFAFTYSINDKGVLAEIILQSIMVYSKLLILNIKQ